MTQNVSSGSSLNDRREHDDSQSSNEIRADIDQTRASVGEKLDQLQQRLDPNRLKQQAQETVQEMIHDTANSMTEYVRTHRDEMVSSVANAARRNPLPTALVGLGLGWLLLESLGGNRQSEDRVGYDRRNYRGSRFSGSTGRSFVSQGRGQYTEEEFSNQGDFYSQYDSPSRSSGSTNYGAMDYGRSGNPTYRPEEMGSQGSMDSSFQGSSGSYSGGMSGSSMSGGSMSGGVGSYPSSTGASYGGSMQGRYESGGEHTTEYGRDYAREYGNGHQRNPLAKAADAVKGTVSDVTGEIKDRVSDVTHDIKDRLSDTGQEIKERMGNMSHDMRDRMGGAAGNMRQQANYMGQRGQEQWSRTNQQMGQQMQNMRRRARYEGRRRGQQMMRNLEDNPLTYGAVALAAGAALALLLPQTRAENRYFGEMRDELMERGQDAMETARMRAQEVAQEVRPELEQAARRIVDDVKESGKDVVRTAQEEIKPVVDKAVSRGKEEATNVAKEAGVDPNKLTGKQPALNRDTLSGQWKQVRGDVKSKWGQLTDDDMTQVEGDYEKLLGKIQSRYGRTREQAEREINDFFSSRNV